jgi:hypothetical protein
MRAASRWLLHLRAGGEQGGEAVARDSGLLSSLVDRVVGALAAQLSASSTPPESESVRL